MTTDISGRPKHFTLRHHTVRSYLKVCADRGIILSPSVRGYLPALLAASTRCGLGRVQYAYKEVGQMFPTLYRSNPDAEYRFVRPAVSFSDEELLNLTEECEDDPALFLKKVKDKVHKNPVALPDIRKVTLEMIDKNIFGGGGKPFTRFETLNLLLKVRFPELDPKMKPEQVDSIPETDMWRRIWHLPFVIKRVPMQVSFGITRQGIKRVELIRDNTDLGFTNTEKFLYKVE